MIKFRRLRWAGHEAKWEEGRSGIKILIGKSTGIRLLRRPRDKWDDNIRMNFKQIGVNTRNWVDSAHDRDCECGIESPGSISHGVSWLVSHRLIVKYINEEKA